MASAETKHTHAPKLYTEQLAERLKSRAGTPYQPSNGMEGEMFMNDWCALCTKDSFNPDTGEGGCHIITLTMALEPSNPAYPHEWQYSAEGQPICTAFEAKATGGAK
jgi:hypothetical protein